MTATETLPRMPWWVSEKFAKAAAGDKPVTAKRATTLAGANWTVEKHPLYAMVWNDEGTQAEYIGPVGDTFGLLREDTKTLLGVVGARYPVVQNVATARWAEEVAEAVNGKIVGSWTLKEGRAFGLTIEPSFASVKVGGEVFEPHLHVLNWHGDGALEAHFTFSSPDGVSLTGAGGVHHIRNTSIVKPVADWAGVQATDFIDAAHRLADTPANQKNLLAVYGKLWPKPSDGAGPKSVSRWKNRQGEILQVWNEDIADEIRATSWGIYLAVNTWAQLRRSFRGSGGDEAKQEALRAEETLLGHAREIGEGAFEALTKGKR